MFDCVSNLMGQLLFFFRVVCFFYLILLLLFREGMPLVLTL